MLNSDFHEADTATKQQSADANYLILSTALLSVVSERRPCSGCSWLRYHTDILVMLISQALPDMNLFKLSHRNPLQMYSVNELQTAHSDVKYHLMTVHAFTGCDTVSAPYQRGKKNAMDILRNNNSLNYLSLLISPDNSRAQVNIVYGATMSDSLDKQRYIMYNQMVCKKPLS